MNYFWWIIIAVLVLGSVWYFTKGKKSKQEVALPPQEPLMPEEPSMPEDTTN